MSPSNLLAVALKVLGVYFLVAGVAAGGQGIRDLLNIEPATEFNSWTREAWLKAGHRELIQSGIYVLGGLGLISGTKLRDGNGTRRADRELAEAGGPENRPPDEHFRASPSPRV
jgi:hypothetical protein